MAQNLETAQADTHHHITYRSWRQTDGTYPFLPWVTCIPHNLPFFPSVLIIWSQVQLFCLRQFLCHWMRIAKQQASLNPLLQPGLRVSASHRFKHQGTEDNSIFWPTWTSRGERLEHWLTSPHWHSCFWSPGFYQVPFFFFSLILKVWGRVGWYEGQISHCFCRQFQTKVLETWTRISYKWEIKCPQRTTFKTYEKS